MLYSSEKYGIIAHRSLFSDGEKMFKNYLNDVSSWEYLKSTSLPIAVYGTGNGADRVFEEFEQLGINVSAVVASDGFVRSREFRGFTVKSISELEREIGDFDIALCFASPLPEVIENIKSLSLRHKVIMPSVPVFDSEIFNKDFLTKHIDEIEHAYGLLADEQSRRVFENIIRFQITGELKYTFECESDKSEALDRLELNNSESFLDLGAYRGDTVDEFLSRVNGYEKIVAVEPDARTFKKLTLNCEGLERCVLLNNAVWGENTVLNFCGNKGRGGSADSHGTKIDTITVDSLFDTYGPFTYINVDVEGCESEMLKGAVACLQTKPKLCMAAYHKSQDLFLLINTVNEINGDYKFYLRHHPHISFWDTNIYCV